MLVSQTAWVGRQVHMFVGQSAGVDRQVSWSVQ